MLHALNIYTDIEASLTEVQFDELHDGVNPLRLRERSGGLRRVEAQLAVALPLMVSASRFVQPRSYDIPN